MEVPKHIETRKKEASMQQSTGRLHAIITCVIPSLHLLWHYIVAWHHSSLFLHFWHIHSTTFNTMHLTNVFANE